eukprot:2076134-Rhodomonas_salina.2
MRCDRGTWGVEDGDVIEGRERDSVWCWGWGRAPDACFEAVSVVTDYRQPPLDGNALNLVKPCVQP